MSILADQMGQLARRIKLPWLLCDANHACATDWVEPPGGGSRGTVRADILTGALFLTVALPARPDDTIDTLCDRARAAVVELLAAMPPKDGLVAPDWIALLARLKAAWTPEPEAPEPTDAEHRAAWSAAQARGDCGHYSHRDPRGSKAGDCPKCGQTAVGL